MKVTARQAQPIFPYSRWAVKGAEQAADAQTLLERVQDLNRHAIAILSRAERDGEHQAALGAIREARGCLELLGKLSGQLQTKQTTNVATNVTVGSSEMSERDHEDAVAQIVGPDVAEAIMIRHGRRGQPIDPDCHTSIIDDVRAELRRRLGLRPLENDWPGIK